MPQPPQEVLTPTTVSERVKSLLGTLFGRVAVEGEVSEVFRAGSGHRYFTLKDRTSVLKGVMWRRDRPAGFEDLLAVGMNVLAWGRLTAYGPQSVYQLVLERLEPRGEGGLRRAYELLRRKLEAEGLFRPERKRRLPLFPERVALLTSPHGAALEDFARTALARFPGARLCLCPVPVQGEGAAREMARALSDMNVMGAFDVIVLTRGGGSAEDLWAFNEEPLVRAVASSRTPVVAAVGHARDVSLAELAADLRAITPTAAAEAVFPDARAMGAEAFRLGDLAARAMRRRLEEERDWLRHLGQRGLAALARRLAAGREPAARLESSLADAARRAASAAAAEAERLASRLAAAAALAFRDARATLGRLQGQLAVLSPARAASLARRDLEASSAALATAGTRLLPPFRTALEREEGRLKLLSPLAVLDRGYSIATGPDGRIIRRAADVSPGDAIRVLLGEGAVAAKVTAREER
jgi:exodeoxyribonuclease VII large subunit